MYDITQNVKQQVCHNEILLQMRNCSCDSPQ